MIVGGACFKLYQVLRHVEFVNGNSFNWPTIKTCVFVRKEEKCFPKNEEKFYLFQKPGSALSTDDFSH